MSLIPVNLSPTQPRQETGGSSLDSDCGECVRGPGHSLTTACSGSLKKRLTFDHLDALSHFWGEKKEVLHIQHFGKYLIFYLKVGNSARVNFGTYLRLLLFVAHDDRSVVT